MVVTITDEEGVFVPIEGVNSFFIEELKSQETENVVISLMARQDTETGSHPLTVTIDYEDNLNASHKVAPTINIPVYMPVRLEAASIVFEDEGQGTALLSFQVINMGRADLSNVNVRIEGNFMPVEFPQMYIGTLKPGDPQYYEDEVMPFEFGELTGEIILEYEDTTGAPGEVRVPLSTFMSEPFFPEFPDDGGRFPPDGEFPWDEEEEAQAMPWWIWAAIGGGALLLLIITIAIVRRVRRKKKEAEDFDD
jgi:hypothetical protein